jgi:hypothetical protein
MDILSMAFTFKDIEFTYIPLQTSRTLEAQSQIANLCQSRAQAEFSDRNWEQCFKWFKLAENLLLELKLKPRLAFNYDYQGLALIEFGRSQGVEVYTKADKLFATAEELFTETCLYGNLLISRSIELNTNKICPDRTLNCVSGRKAFVPVTLR